MHAQRQQVPPPTSAKSPIVPHQPCPDPHLVDRLLERIAITIDEATITALGETGDPRAVDALLDALTRTGERATDFVNFSQRLKIVRALECLADPRALPTLRVLAQTDIQPIDAWGLAAFSITEVAQEVVEKIEWRLYQQGIAIPPADTAEADWDEDQSHDLSSDTLLFPALFKHPPEHPAVQSLVQRFGGVPRVSQVDTFGWVGYSFSTHGVALRFMHGTLSTVFIYVRPAEGYAAWSVPLPHRLHPAMNRAQVRKRLGPPESGSNLYE